MKVFYKTSEMDEYEETTVEYLQQLIGDCMMNSEVVNTIYNCEVRNGNLYIETA